MKKLLSLGLALMSLCLILGCMPQDVPSPTAPSAVSTTAPTAVPTTEPTTIPTTEPTTIPTTEPTTVPTTVPEHSPLYMPNLSVEDVILFFNEVCLDAEIVNAGDPTRLQKWVVPIRYSLSGAYTQDDLATLESFVSWLNAIEGFPGMHPVEDPELSNLSIHFCDYDSYISLMGENFYDTDGGVTFWYNGADQIYDAIIGYRTDIDQQVRNSVILEEIYNGLGPINDTELRLNSVIYAEYSIPQWLSQEDQLILKLLYHPQMECGMDAAQCEAVIRQLYY